MTCEKHTTRNIHPSTLLTFTPTMRSMYKMTVVESGQGKRGEGRGGEGNRREGGKVAVVAAAAAWLEDRCRG